VSRLLSAAEIQGANSSWLRTDLSVSTTDSNDSEFEYPLHTAADLIRADNILTDPWVPLVLYRDGFGNWCTRLVAPVGHMRITADALINDRGLTEPVVSNAQQHTVESLPEETLVYLLGSRYCDTSTCPLSRGICLATLCRAGRAYRRSATSSISTSHSVISSRAQPRLPRKRSTNDRRLPGLRAFGDRAMSMSEYSGSLLHRLSW